VEIAAAESLTCILQVIPCKGLAGQFHKFRQYGGEEGKRHALEIRDDLYQIVRNSPVMMLGVTLSVPFHRTMLGDTATFGRIPEVPYRLAFQQVIAECGKAMLLLGRGSVVTFWHDEGNDFKALHELYDRFKELNPQYSNVLRDFAPLDDTQHPPMQAADVAAWMAYQFANDFCDNGGQVGPDNVIHRVDGHFYKIVNC
jgi:hypothetical protein